MLLIYSSLVTIHYQYSVEILLLTVYAITENISVRKLTDHEALQLLICTMEI